MKLAAWIDVSTVYTIVLLKNVALTIEESKPQHKGIDSAIHCTNACYANSDQYMNRGKFLKRTDHDKFPSKSKPPGWLVFTVF